MLKTKPIFIGLLILFAFMTQQIYSQTCDSDCDTCISDGVCGQCKDEDVTVDSNCKCPTGKYYDINSTASDNCERCDDLCDTCTNGNTCTSCVNQQGLNLNLITNKCECNDNYKSSGNKDKYCVHRYKYGDSRVDKCPKGTKQNENTYQCETTTPEDVLPGDRIWILIVSIVIIIVQILLALMLYNYLLNKIAQAHRRDMDRKKVLSEEESEYLANQAEYERSRLQEEEAARRAIEEEERRRRRQEWEEEQKRKSLEYEAMMAEKLRQEELRRQQEARDEEERLRQLAEEQERRRRELEEKLAREAEEMRLRAEMEAARQKQLDEEAARKRKEYEEEQERLRRLEEEEKKRLALELAEKQRLEAEEAERRRREQEEENARLAREAELQRQREEAERLERERLAEQERLERERLEELERQRLAAEAAEKERLRKLAEAARLARQQERALKKQATMAANDDKLAKMRAERERLKREKEGFQSDMDGMLNNANKLDGQCGDLNDEIKEAEKRAEEARKIKESIIKKKLEMDAQRAEMDKLLEGVDYEGARKKVNDLSAEDIVFIQNLRTPPDRIKLCLEAVAYITTNSSKKNTWDDIKKIITNANFRKSLYTYDPMTMSTKVENQISKDNMNNPLWVIPKMYKASKAAGVLCEWVDSLIKFKNLMTKNKVLFEQNKQLQETERSMQSDLDRLEELEELERQAEEKKKVNSQQINGLQDKQKLLKNSATMKEQDINKKMEEINALKTDNMTLQEVSDEEDSDDAENEAILNNL